jgi:hypothetical protein
VKVLGFLYAFLVMVYVPPVAAQTVNRVKEAADLILRLCIAGGAQSVEINRKGNSIELSGTNGHLEIDRRESSGLVGGISKEITALSAQQASEARSCTQKYLKELLDIILKDDFEKQTVLLDRAGITNGILEVDQDRYWGGRGLWQDNENYCEHLLEFLSASFNPSLFRFANNGQQVSIRVFSGPRSIQGNYFIRTDLGSNDQFCGVSKGSPYNPIYCSRPVSYGRPDIFSSVFNQTLKDLRSCLVPDGWRQTSLDQGACIPTVGTGGECVRRFSKGARNVWLYSLFSADSGSEYSIGIQTELGIK